MISKIFGKKKKDTQEDGASKQLREKIAKMSLSEMGLYIKERLDGVELTEEGVVFVLERLISKVNDKRYYLSKEDDDTKLKKAFDLIINIAKNKKITVKGMELIALFYETYEALIKEYDKKHKEIYQERIKKAIDTAMGTIEAKVALQNRINALE